MKKHTGKIIIFVLICLAAIAGLAACSHNAVQYSDGIGFETVCRPDTGNFGITFRYGKILSVVARENSEIEMTGTGESGGNSGDNKSVSASNSGNVKIKIGKQITGYYVDALEAGASPEQLNAYLSGDKTGESVTPTKETETAVNAVKTP